jgi:hypothetical protein
MLDAPEAKAGLAALGAERRESAAVGKAAQADLAAETLHTLGAWGEAAPGKASAPG